MQLFNLHHPQLLGNIPRSEKPFAFAKATMKKREVAIHPIISGLKLKLSGCIIIRKFITILTAQLTTKGLANQLAKRTVGK